MIVYGCIVFFQAEDGIRDLVRSRGLGDVYKRQVDPPPERRRAMSSGAEHPVDRGDHQNRQQGRGDAVSYTHLTLPTSDLV